MKTLKTYLGNIEIEYVYKNSLGYFAVTGKGLYQRTWTITKQEFERLKD